MKKILSMIITAALLVSTLSACGESGNSVDTSGDANSSSQNSSGSDGADDEKEESADVVDPFAPYEETLTITIGKTVRPTIEFPEGQDIYNNQYTNFIAEQLNIKFEYLWEAAAGNDASQKMNLAIASNDLPDLMTVNETQFRVMAENGQIQEMGPYLDYLAPNLKRTIESTSKAIDVATIDGKIMALPQVNPQPDAMHITWVRKDWLDELGLEGPETVDDLENIAREFIEKDPGENGEGNTIGISGPASGGALYANVTNQGCAFYGFDSIFSAYDAFPGFFVNDDEGNVVYGSTTQETRDALERLATMYSEDLIDPQMGIRNDSAETVISGQSGIMMGPWWAGDTSISKTLDNDPTANWQAYVLTNSEGEVNTKTMSISSLFGVAKTGFSNPEAIVKINNILLNGEGNDLDKNALNIGEYPLRMLFAPYDQGPNSVEAYYDLLNGETSIDDYRTEEYSNYPHLIADLEAAPLVKKSLLMI